MSNALAVQDIVEKDFTATALQTSLLYSWLNVPTATAPSLSNSEKTQVAGEFDLPSWRNAGRETLVPMNGVELKPKMPQLKMRKEITLREACKIALKVREEAEARRLKFAEEEAERTAIWEEENDI